MPSGRGTESTLTSRHSCSSVISISVTEQVCVVTRAVTGTFRVYPCPQFKKKTHIHSKATNGAQTNVWISLREQDFESSFGAKGWKTDQ